MKFEWKFQAISSTAPKRKENAQEILLFVVLQELRPISPVLHLFLWLGNLTIA